MDAREGQLDPLSGQRAAFPLDSAEDSNAVKYLLNVRAEAEELAVAKALSRKRPRDELHDELHEEEHDATDGMHDGIHDGADEMHGVNMDSGARLRPPSRPAPEQSQLLNYDSQLNTAEVINITDRLYGGASKLNTQVRGGLPALYKAAKPGLDRVSPVHPVECTSLATWKEYVTTHDPIPLNHVDTFRMYKYLSKWLVSRFQENHAIWAWSLLLRTPTVLSGDEVALLRDVTRALALVSTSDIAKAFVFIVGTEFGQRDLLLLE